MTIEEILAATTAKSTIGLSRPKAGSINVFLWSAAKAIQSREIADLTRAYKQLLQLRADGSLELLPTVEQSEMIDFIVSELDKYKSGEASALKIRRGDFNDKRHHEVAVTTEALRARVTDLETKVNDLSGQVAMLTKILRDQNRES